MSTKRPKSKNTINTGGRSSTLGGRNKNFKTMLAQQSQSVDHKLQDKLNRERQLKAERKKEVEDMQREHGMVDESQQRAKESDSRRQYRLFLDSVFIPPATSVVYNGDRLFRTREAMQLYYQRQVDPKEWNDNNERVKALQQKQILVVDLAGGVPSSEFITKPAGSASDISCNISMAVSAETELI